MKNGADVNAVNSYNNTALHEAAYWAYKVRIALLYGTLVAVRGV